MDLDLDDLEAPTGVQSRISRFNPKSSKPRPKSEPLVSVSVKTEPSVSNSDVKMEEDETGAQEPSEDDPMDEDDEVDTVVLEIDVFFNPLIDTNSKLYVVQYPMRPCWRPYDIAESCEEVRVKPVASEVEIDLSMETTSKNYDSDEIENGFRMTNDSHKLRMPKLTLSSSWGPTCTSDYAIGVVRDKKLYLNPIHAVVQLRPSREHLKTADSRMKKYLTANADGAVKLEESISSPKQNRQKVSSMQPKTNEERWVQLRYHGSDSDISARYLQKMVAEESSPINFMMKPHEYLSSFPGVTNEHTISKPAHQRYLLTLPLEERIKKLLCEEPPIKQFNSIKHFAPDESIEDVLEVLQRQALLVQGLWVPKASTEPGEQLPGEQFVRDYVLLLFSKNPVVPVAQLNLPPKLVRIRDKILNIFAVARPSLNDWKFKGQTDYSFIKLHREIVNKQKQVWDNIEVAVSAQLSTRAKGGPGAKNAMTKPGMFGKPEKSFKNDKGTTNVSGGQTGKHMSKETREALPKALQKLFQTHKVCSFQLICNGLRGLAISEASLPKADSRTAINAAYAADAPPEELLEIISQIAVEIHGYYVLKSSPEHPEFDPLRKVVIDLLRGKERNSKLKKAEILEAAKFALKKDIPNNEYTKVMNDFCEYKSSAWVLRSDGM